MGGKLKAMTGAECFDESYGVDGDGLGEGEVSYQEELENEIFAWSPDDDALMCASVEVVKNTASGGKVDRRPASEAPSPFKRRLRSQPLARSIMTYSGGNEGAAR